MKALLHGASRNDKQRVLVNMVLRSNAKKFDLHTMMIKKSWNESVVEGEFYKFLFGWWLVAHFWKTRMFNSITWFNCNFKAYFQITFWLHALMKGYKRLKILISSLEWREGMMIIITLLSVFASSS